MSAQSTAQVQPAVASASQRSVGAVRPEGGVSGPFAEVSQLSAARGLGPQEESVGDQRRFGEAGRDRRPANPDQGGVNLGATLPRFSEEVARLLVQVQTAASALNQAGAGVEATTPPTVSARQGVQVYQRYMRYLAAA